MRNLGGLVRGALSTALSTALAVVVSTALLAVAGPVSAGEGDIAAAKRKANEIARRLAQARGRVAELDDRITSLEAQGAEVRARHALLGDALSTMAVRRYMLGGEPQSARVLSDDGGHEAARADALAKLVVRDADSTLDSYRKAGEDLEHALAALEVTKRDADEALEESKARSRQIQTELARLEKLEAERKAREEAARRQRERQALAEKSRTRPVRTAPTGSASTVAGGDGWLCPVQGAVAFSNDWGDPRSGGRRHEGTDLLAARGTPVVASVSGIVRPHNSARGGISYYLAGDDGNTYFGTHLDSLSGASGRVERGTVLGAVGNSGNASGGPNHLHFEIHPGGGAPVNPYPTIARYC